MRNFTKRKSEIWAYPPLCKYHDQIDDFEQFVKILTVVRKARIFVYISIFHFVNHSVCFVRIIRIIISNTPWNRSVS